MKKRLLENWLDNASERSYQAPFCQMLVNNGHTIIHNARHSALEFGKDVITIDKAGNYCAFQLKANPGGRLTLDQFRGIQAQLVQLITQPISIPGQPVGYHKSYLVTNGEVEEEVVVAMRDLNAFHEGRSPGAPISYINRGKLLGLANNMEGSLWPSELSKIDLLIKFLSESGEGQISFIDLHLLLIDLFKLDKDDTVKINEAKRRVTSAAILISTCLARYNEKSNYYASICAWTMYCSYVIAFCDKNKIKNKNILKPFLGIALNKIYFDLSELCNEATERKHLSEGDVLSDFLVYKGRKLLLTSLASLFWFWGKEVGFLKDVQEEKIKQFLFKNNNQIELWGEGAIPQVLIYIWFMRENKVGFKPDIMLADLLKYVVALSISDKQNGLPSPYYTYEEVCRHALSKELKHLKDPFDGESFHKTSYYAKSILHLLVRANFKQTCKTIWPGFSKIRAREFIPDEKWQYCLYRSMGGKNIEEVQSPTKLWSELTEESRNVSCQNSSNQLIANRYLLMLFVLIFPFRGTSEVIRRLGYLYNKCWFIDSPIDN